MTTGKVLLQSDGTPWRPLVHFETSTARSWRCSRAGQAIHNQAFNVGGASENYQIREIAEMIERLVPDTRVSFAEGGGPDKRSYQVDCSKIRLVLPEFEPQWIVPDGVEELYQSYVDNGLTFDEFTGSGYLRIKRVQELQAAGQVDDDLRWLAPVRAAL